MNRYKMKIWTGPTFVRESSKRYILWNPRDGRPRRNEEGEIESDGVFGRIGCGNVYLTAYPGEMTRSGRRAKIADLEENTVVPIEATYRLSGSKGTYEIFRVSDLAEQEEQP